MLAHLKPLVICALDSGMRRGELFKLTWANVDFTSRLVSLPQTITKTMKARTVGITSRMYDELIALYEKSDKNPESLVFGITDNCKRSWTTACRLANVKGLRFHDLRHSYVTRLINAGIPAAEAMKT